MDMASINNSMKTASADRIFATGVGLYLVYVFSLPFMVFPALNFLGHQIQISDFIFIPLALFSACLWLKNRVKLDQGYILSGALIILTMGLELSIADNLIKAGLRIIIQVYLLFIFCISFLMARMMKELKPIFLSWAASAAAIIFAGMIGIVLYYFGFDFRINLLLASYGMALPSLPLPRVKSFLVGAEYLANYLIPSFFFLYYGRRSGNRYLRSCFIYFPILAGLVVVDLLTFSQAFFLWAVPLLAWKSIFPGKRIARWKTLAGTFLISLILMEVVMGSFFSIALSKPETRSPLPGRLSRILIKPGIRQEFWGGAIAQIKEHPFLGLGLDRPGTGPLKFGNCKGCDLPEGADAHNLVLNLWSTRGFLGMISYLIFLLVILSKSTRAVFRGPASLEIQVLFWAVIGMVLTSFFVDIEDFRHLYLCLGLLAGLSSRPAVDAPVRLCRLSDPQAHSPLKAPENGIPGAVDSASSILQIAFNRIARIFLEIWPAIRGFPGSQGLKMFRRLS